MLMTTMKDNAGFTIIELMVTVAVIAILCAIAVPNFMGLQERAKRRVMKEVAFSAKSELHHWLDAANNNLRGVVDVNGDHFIDPDEFHADLLTVPSSWIQSFYRQRGGTVMSPWGGRGIFTVVPATNIICTGQIVLHPDQGGRRIQIRAYNRNGDMLFSDSVAIE